MPLYIATIHAEEPITVEIQAQDDREAFDKATDLNLSTSLMSLTLRQDTPVLARRGTTPNALTERLWAIADGVGQRDSLETWAMLMQMVKDLERPADGGGQ
jgi:hypothetical protein